MSHFSVLIVGEFVDDQLAKFDENIQVEAYVPFTKEDKYTERKNRIEEYEKILKEGNKERYNLKAVEEHLQELKKTKPIDYYKKAVGWYEKKNKKGEPLTEYNPDSKWDWYEIGGRWAGSLILKKEAYKRLVESGEYAKPHFSWGWDKKEMAKVEKQMRTDSALKSDIDFKAMEKKDKKPFTTFAVVMDGRWYESGKMGWFGMSSDNCDEQVWEKEFQKMLFDLPDDTRLTVVDCHI